MKTIILATLIASAASAGTISYNTLGSTLLCGGAVGCVQNGGSTVTLADANGQITLTYATATALNVVFPSFIGLGHVDITVTGTPGTFALSGILLTINVNSQPPGAGGTLPNGYLSGSISASSSTGVINFSPSNTSSTLCPACPGVVIGSGVNAVVYQVATTSISLPSPIGGIGPLNERATAIAAATTVSSSTIGGVVTTPGAAAPEPGTWFLLSTALISLGLARKRRQP